MTFKTKPYDAPRKPHTPAQEVASTRAFKLFRLRGLYSLAYILTPNRRVIVHALIDQDIAALGGEPQGERLRRQEAERDARWRAEGGPDLSQPIPF